MAVTKKEQTADERDQEVKEVDMKRQNAVNAVLSSFDLPTEAEVAKAQGKPPPNKEGEKPVKEKPKEEKPKEEEKPAETEVEGDMTPEELLKTPDEELTEEGLEIKKKLQEKIDNKEDEDEDGELIPKSKVDKRFKQLTAEIRELKKERAEAKANTAEDQDTIKLEKMGEDKLFDAKRKVRKAQATENDDDKLDALVDLELKIDKAIQTLPTRFNQTQVALFDEVMEEIAEDTGASFKKVGPQIKQVAADIYNRYPRFKRIEEGQAMALRLAYDHFKISSQVTGGKPEDSALRRATTKNKKKLSLDSNKLKIKRTNIDGARIKEKAHTKGATSLDKREFIKSSPRFNIDALIPDEFKGG